MSGFIFIKANYKSINMIIRNNITTSSALFLEKLASKTLPQTFKLDRLETGRGRKCRSLPKVCGPTVPTLDLLALSNLQRPSAAHGSKQLFLHNNANSWPPSQVWQSRSSLVMWLSPRGTLNLHAHSSSPSDGLVFVQNLFSVIYFSASSNSVLWGCKHRGNYASVTVYD